MMMIVVLVVKVVRVVVKVRYSARNCNRVLLTLYARHTYCCQSAVYIGCRSLCRGSRRVAGGGELIQ